MAVPVVTSLDISNGPSGTYVVIYGSNFDETTSKVEFGAVSAGSNFVLFSESELGVVAPHNDDGAQYVYVTNSSGKSAASVQFTYSGSPGGGSAPSITQNVSPQQTAGTDGLGGDEVAIVGSNFSTATKVEFGGVSASFVINSNTSITAIAPPNAFGTVDIIVSNPYGSSANTSYDNFTYQNVSVPTATAIAPARGLPGIWATVTGTNLLTTTAVVFENGGTTYPAQFVVLDATHVSCLVPALPFGSSYTVYVTTQYGTTASGPTFVCAASLGPTTTATGLQVSPSVGWVTSDTQAVTLAATDDVTTPGDNAGAGISKTFYKVDAGNVTEYSASFNVTGAGSHKVEYWSVAKDGRVEPAKSGWVNLMGAGTSKVPAGLTATPAIGAVELKWNPVPVMTPCWYVVYGDGANPPTTELTVTQSSTFTVQQAYDEGAKWYAVASRDAAGNTSSKSTAVAARALQSVTTEEDIANGIISIASFAGTLTPPRVVSALPTLPNQSIEYPSGSMVFLTSDRKLYVTTGGGVNTNTHTDKAKWQDLSGNSNDFTLTSFEYDADSGWASDPYALLFRRGSGDYINRAADSDFDTVAAFTWEFWYKPTTVTGGTWYDGLVMHETYPTKGYRIGVKNTGSETGQVHIWSTQNGGTLSQAASVVLTAGEWHHIVITYNGTTAYVWVNGAKNGGATGTIVSPTTTGVLIGAAITESLDGSVAVARRYNAVLSDSQIAAHLAMGASGYSYQKTSLVLDLNARAALRSLDWYKVVNTTDLDGTISYGQLATDIVPPRLVDNLPTLPNASYPANSYVVLTTDHKLYVTKTGLVGSWVKVVNATDLDGQISETQIADNAITTGKIAANAVEAGDIKANTITAGQIAGDTITAAQIAAGAIGASELAAGSVFAKNVVIGNFDNLIPNPMSEWDDTGKDKTSGGDLDFRMVEKNAAIAYKGTGYRKIAGTGAAQYVTITQNLIPCSSGEQYFLSAYLKNASAASAGTGAQVLFVGRNAAGSPIAWNGCAREDSTSWTQRTVAWTVPAGTDETDTVVSFCIQITTSVANGNSSYFDNLFCGRKNDGSLIVDGSITTDHILANTIKAGDIEAAAIGTDQLAANAVTAAKMAITDFTNLLDNPRWLLSPNTLGWTGVSGQASIVNDTLPDGTTGAVLQIIADGADRNVQNRLMDCLPTDEFWGKAYVRVKTAGDTNGTIEVASTIERTSGGTLYQQFANINPSTMTTGTWYEVKGGLGPIAYAKSIKFRVAVLANLASGTFQFAFPEFRRKNAGSLIVDGSIVAAHLTSNCVEADNILAGQVKTSHLYVAATGSTLNDDPSCLDSTAWSTYQSSTAAFATITDGKVGNGVMRSPGAGTASWMNGAHKVPVDPSKVYRFRCWARTVSGTGNTFYAGVALFDSSGANITGDGNQWYYVASGVSPGGTWTEYTGTFGAGTAKTLPANARTMVPLVIFSYGTGTCIHEAQDVRIEERIPGNLIVDGAVTATNLNATLNITGKTITGGTIRTDVSPNMRVQLTDGTYDDRISWFPYTNCSDADSAYINTGGSSADAWLQFMGPKVGTEQGYLTMEAIDGSPDVSLMEVNATQLLLGRGYPGDNPYQAESNCIALGGAVSIGPTRYSGIANAHEFLRPAAHYTATGGTAQDVDDWSINRLSVNGYTVTGVTTDGPHHPGVLQLSSNAASGSGCFMRTGYNAIDILDSGAGRSAAYDYDYCEFTFRVPYATNTRVRMGFMNGPNLWTSGAPTTGDYGAFIDVNGTTVQGMVYVNGTQHAATSGSIVANTWYTAKILIKDGTDTYFWVYAASTRAKQYSPTGEPNDPSGTPVAYAPTGDQLGHGFVCWTAGSSAQNIFDIDYMNYYLAPRDR